MTLMLKQELLNFKSYLRIVQITVKMDHTLIVADTMVHNLIATVKKSFYTFTKSGIPKNPVLTTKNNFQLKTGRLCLYTKSHNGQMWSMPRWILTPSTEVPTRTILQSSACTFSRCTRTTPIGESKRHQKSVSWNEWQLFQRFQCFIYNLTCDTWKEPIHMKLTPYETNTKWEKEKVAVSVQAVPWQRKWSPAKYSCYSCSYWGSLNAFLWAKEEVTIIWNTTFKTTKAKDTLAQLHQCHMEQDEVLKDLQSHPPAPPRINWQNFARQHNTPGKNCGQVVKEFAVKSGIDVSRLEGVSESKTRQRSMLRRLPGGEISAPADPPSHPAQQYERGTQHGGTYKCACACKQSMFEDFAHTVHCEWRSLNEIQKIATSGKYGKQAGQLKPLDSLLVAQLREELHARSVYDTDKCKPELQIMLTNILMGIQRVPTLLLLNPCQNLSNLHLQGYTVLRLWTFTWYQRSLWKSFQGVATYLASRTEELLQRGHWG